MFLDIYDFFSGCSVFMHVLIHTYVEARAVPRCHFKDAVSLAA